MEAGTSLPSVALTIETFTKEIRFWEELTENMKETLEWIRATD